LLIAVPSRLKSNSLPHKSHVKNHTSSELTPNDLQASCRQFEGSHTFTPSDFTTITPCLPPQSKPLHHRLYPHLHHPPTMTAIRPWDRYIFNILPLPHTLLLTLLLTVTFRIAISFHFHYGARPILTLCVVSSLLASISDTLAQMVETIRLRSKMAAKYRDILPPSSSSQMQPSLVEIELDEKVLSPQQMGGLSPRWETERDGAAGAFVIRVDRAIDFDFPRMIRFMGYGFFFAPIAVGSPFHYCG